MPMQWIVQNFAGLRVKMLQIRIHILKFIHIHFKIGEYHRKLQDMAQPALDKKHFKVYLQPKYELEGETLAGAEALVRWEDPVEGMMPLYEFIPLFEQTGFMRQIDYFVFESVLELIEKWMDEGIEPIPISVNLSKSHFTAKKFFDEKFLPIFERHHVPKKYIEFEISESVMLDDAGVLIDLVQKLEDSGFAYVLWTISGVDILL